MATDFPERMLMTIAPRDKDRLKLLFLAKHALAGGGPDTTDGNHAVYHHEMLTTLRDIGLRVEAANDYPALFEKPQADFVIPLLNRGGFQNSEMLAPLLLARHGLPYLGATPILRGLSDDKHLMKLAARAHGVPTMDWCVCRIGTPAPTLPPFHADRYVVKPNASSASWGVGIFERWRDVIDAVEALHALRHDVIVEAWAGEIDIAVPVVGGRDPWVLPAMAYCPETGTTLRSYEEKRGLVTTPDDPLIVVEDELLRHRLERHSRTLMRELWPFDYGRFEFRVDPATGEVKFMEVNLSCNLWSKKTISRSAATLGVSHAQLVETIVAHSMTRQGLIEDVEARPARRSAGGKVSALVLAGKREGGSDPLAIAHGVSHKCLIPIGGVPMIVHAVSALAASPEIGEIAVSIDDAALLETIAELRPLLGSGRLRVVASAHNIADSVAAGAATLAFPILVTTADNALLTPASVSDIVARAQGSDAAVAFTRRASVLAAHPEGQRRFYEFADDAYSNCNSYWLGNPAAMRTIEVFRSGGQFVKKPGRILGALGLVSLICFIFGIGSLERAFARLSRRFRLDLRAVIVADGALAIDVDNGRSYAIAAELLAAREKERRIAA